MRCSEEGAHLGLVSILQTGIMKVIILFTCSFHEASGIGPLQLQFSAGASHTATPDGDMKCLHEHKEVG